MADFDVLEPDERPSHRRSARKRPAQAEHDGGAGRSRTPHLDLAGFNGSLELLLDLARDERIDLAGVSLSELLDQLATALHRGGPLLEKADWVVIASRIVELRSRLLLPPEAPAQEDAVADAAQLRDRLGDLQLVRALAGWLEARPQAGRDVFLRGAHDQTVAAFAADAGGGVDVIEFLWAAAALFEGPLPDTSVAYRPRPPGLHSVADARARILALLADAPKGLALPELLPPPNGAKTAAQSKARKISAWSSTFVAGLELAKRGEVGIEQPEAFGSIVLRRSEASAERSV
jgi:segregation and condensation protein A